MEIEKQMSALRTSMEAERGSLRHYLKFARATEDESGKNMFLVLAADEVDHYELLEKQLDSLRLKGEVVEVEVKRSVVEELVPRLKDDMKRDKGKEGLGQMEALSIAYDLENRGVNFYREQAELNDNPAAKDMYRRLAAMEEAHLCLIQAEMDAIEGTGFWFDIPEFRLESG
ncbi:ferritin family protein [candidate division KSB1 bacterium]